MILEIANQIRIVKPEISLKLLLIDMLKIPNPKFEQAVQQGYSTWGIKPYIFNFSLLPDDSLVIPRGMRKKLLTMSDTMGIKYEIDDKRTLFPMSYEVKSSAIKYRLYQNPAIVKLITAGDEGILRAPAGSGKTIMGLSLLPLFGQPTLWLTHTKNLARQTKRRALKFLPDLNADEIGFIGDGKFKIGKMLTIGLVQSLRDTKRLSSIINSFGLVILDEAHHCPADTFKGVISYLNPYYLYGLTATPYRSDGLDPLMFQVMGEVTSYISTEEVVKYGGIMIPTVKYKTIKSKRIEGNDTKSIITEHIINNRERNSIIVADVLAEATDNHICVILCERRSHCENLYEIISKWWDKTGIATGKYSEKLNEEQVEKLENKKITVLITTFKLLGEGFDVDIIDRIFIASPFRAKQMVEQLVGRVQRTAKDKKDAIVYEYVDENIPVLLSQFYSKQIKENRYNSYIELGLTVVPC